MNPPANPPAAPSGPADTPGHADSPGRAAPSSQPDPAARADRPRARRPGRPPRMDRAAIARAAGEIPLEDLTLRAVAERLGVSVPGLYHYVRGRDDLIRLAAEQSALQLSMPRDHGQHWAVWFVEWAAYTHRAFVNDPELLKHFIDGSVGPQFMAPYTNAAIGLCVRQGFTPRAALDAYELVLACATGAAVTTIRADRARAEADPADVALRRVLAQGAQDLPYLAAVLNAGPYPDQPPLMDQLSTVLAGIATRRGEPWQDIEPLLASVAEV